MTCLYRSTSSGTPRQQSMHHEQTSVRRFAVNAISLFLLLAATAIVMFAALRSPLKDDIAWLLYVAHRWLAGRELYVDVIEVNPPLIVWISAIPLTVARWLDAAHRFRYEGLK